MSEWRDFQLSALATFRKGINYTSSDYGDGDSGRPFITIKCFVKGGGYEGTGLKYIRGEFRKEDQLSAGDVLFSVTDLTRAGDIVGSPLQVPSFGEDIYSVASMDCMKVEPNDAVCNKEFLYQRMMLWDIRRQMVAYSAGSTVLHLDTKQVPRITGRFPVDTRIQQKIARILQTIDQAIEKTEALIDKYQQIKAGLMHDLFTRGIGPDGQLRAPRKQAPDLYRETPFGWIPKEWGVLSVGDVLETVVDGPFGSNLKTEHYVEDPGVRVVRLQNVLDYEYNDSDRAYISEKHASMLVRNKVVGDDVLIAGLGEDKFPVGRSCIYPKDLPLAINKADCFRVRCVPDIASNKFFMLFLNSMLARSQVRRYEQGVTRSRINTENLKRLQVAIPAIAEQRPICRQFDSAQTLIDIERGKLEKLQRQKSGLMHDLLTGKVRVQVNPEAEPEAAHV